jgi:hypothetical protein
MVRSSSLSVLASVATILRYGSLPYVSEIIEVTSQALLIEKDAEVRRGAVFLYTCIFETFGMEMFTVYALDIRRIYRTLKWISTEDCDDVTQYHATSAIAELVSIARQYLMPIEDDSPLLHIHSVRTFERELEM